MRIPTASRIAWSGPSPVSKSPAKLRVLPIRIGSPMICGLQPAALRTRNTLASNTETICVQPYRIAASPIPARSSPSAGPTPFRCPSCDSDGAVQILEDFQIVPLSMISPSRKRNGKTSRSMFGPTVGSRRKDPRYLPVFGSTEIKYSGPSSSNRSRSKPFSTTTSHLSLSEKTSARLRNIASISGE